MIFIIYFLIFMTHYLLPHNCPFCALFFFAIPSEMMNGGFTVYV
jgi:hypothetical protein